jgi:DnaK suppressor protein
VQRVGLDWRRMPADGDRHEEHRERLARLRAEVETGLALRDLGADADARDDGHHHPAEAATDADQRERDLRDRLRWEERLRRVERAEHALEEGSYGRCADCGVEIPGARLEVFPDAERCVDCQRAVTRRI